LQTPPQINDISSSFIQGSYYNNIELSDIIPAKLGRTVGEEEALMQLLTELPSDGFD